MAEAPLTQNRITELFAFNLLPPKTKEEVKKDVKRKNMIFNSMLIPAAVLAVTSVMYLLNTLALDYTIAGWQDTNAIVTAELNDQNSDLGKAKTTNGELKIKTDYIADPVQKNVDYEQIFKVAEQIFDSNQTGSVITSYGREEAGVFTINAVSTSDQGPVEILGRFQTNDLVQSPSLRNVSKVKDTGKYQFTISFTIKFKN